LSCRRGKEPGTLALTLEGKSLVVSLEEGQTWRKNAGVSVEPHISFLFEDDGIRISAGVSTFFEEIPWNVYIAHITANATFDGKRFHLSDLKLEPIETL